MMYDVLLKNGNVIDGAGTAGYRGDIALSGEKIAAVGTNLGNQAIRIIDLEGMVVCPGFIDIHTHSDLAVFGSSIEAKLRQGVTTEIVGNCGFSVCPVPDERQSDAAQFLSPVLGTAERFGWHDVDSYFRTLDEAGLLINVGTLIGHGTLRLAAMGFSAEQPTEAQQKQIQALLRNSYEQGAWGMSTGLVYAPGCYASFEELRDLCELGVEYGVPYVSHLRSEAGALVEAVEEALAFGRATGVHVHFSHHQVDGYKNKGKAEQTLALIEAARADGMRVTLDQYPYQAGSTQLLAMLPQWVLDQGRPAVLKRLRSSATRKRIRQEFESGNPDLLITDTGWENVMLNSLPVTGDLEQVTLRDAARQRGQEQVDALLDVVLENGGEGTVVLFDQNEEDWGRIFRDPHCSIASDSILVGEKPHPRSFGTYPHVFGTLVREKGVVSLEDAVRKCTSLPAETFRIPQLGELRPGYRADIVVFDEFEIGHAGTFKDPARQPCGIEHVFIAGQPVLARGEPTGVKAGRTLRHERYQ